MVAACQASAYRFQPFFDRAHFSVAGAKTGYTAYQRKQAQTGSKKEEKMWIH